PRLCELLYGGAVPARVLGLTGGRVCESRAREVRFGARALELRLPLLQPALQEEDPLLAGVRRRVRRAIRSRCDPPESRVVAPIRHYGTRVGRSRGNTGVEARPRTVGPNLGAGVRGCKAGGPWSRNSPRTHARPML